MLPCLLADIFISFGRLSSLSSSLSLFTLIILLGDHHKWASTSISMSAISDIRHWHLLFRYRRQICRTEKSHSDIGSVLISTSEFIPISDIEETKILLHADSNPRPIELNASTITPCYCDCLL
jgi:hypothetical protein